MGHESIDAGLALTKDDPSKILGLTIGSHKITTPGSHIKKADAKPVPEISINRATGTYVVICMDPDAPFPSFPFLGPILHWAQAGLTPTPAGDGTYKLSATDVPFICNYGPPGPPGISAPHRYVFLLYEQPEGFDNKVHESPGGKARGIPERMRYDLSAFEKKLKLGPVIACNYFVSN